MQLGQAVHLMESASEMATPLLATTMQWNLAVMCRMSAAGTINLL